MPFSVSYGDLKFRFESISVSLEYDSKFIPFSRIFGTVSGREQLEARIDNSTFNSSYLSIDERQRKREGVCERERGERVRESVCVCVCQTDRERKRKRARE